MKFGKYFHERITSEWQTQYLDYKHLKKIIKEIKQKRKLNQSYDQIIYFFENEILKEIEKLKSFFQNTLDRFSNRQGHLMKQTELLHQFPNEKKKQILIKAFQEHYRGLEILKQYISLNEMAFTKIKKKFEKNSNSRLNLTVIFERSQVVHFLINETAYNFIQEFTNGDRKKGMKLIRFRTEKQVDYGVIFRVGFWTGLDVFFTISFIVIYIYVKFHPIQIDDLENKLYSFKIILFPVLLLIFISLNLRIWSIYKINYRFIMDIDPRHHLTKWEFTEISTIAYCLFMISVNIFLFLEIFRISYTWVVSIALIGIYLIWILLPLPIFYYESRVWILKTIIRVITAPLFPVLFKDFFIADQFTSLSDFLFDIQFVFCFYSFHIRTYEDQFCSVIHSLGLPILNVIPFYIRMMQCLRKYFETAETYPHLVNSGKYMISAVVIIFAYVDTTLIPYLGVWNFMKIMWLIINIIATIFRVLWDIYFDWGLFRRSKNFLLRNQITFHSYIYYFSIILDILIRFQWIILLFLNLFLFLNQTVKFWITIFYVINELLRRFIWNIFRMENEHLYNCEHFRVINEIPLPFEEVSNSLLLNNYPVTASI